MAAHRRGIAGPGSDCWLWPLHPRKKKWQCTRSGSHLAPDRLECESLFAINLWRRPSKD
jgi:hypothetical protein